MPLTKSSDHIIGRHIIDLKIYSGEYRSIQEDISGIFKTRLGNALDKLFDEVTKDNEAIIRLENLSLDIGTIERDDLDTEFEKRVIDKLRSLLSNEIRKTSLCVSLPAENPYTGRPEAISLTQSRHQAEILFYFLSNGRLPWWVKPVPGQNMETLFAECIRDSAEESREFLFNNDRKELITRRLINQFSEKLIYSLIEILEPNEAAFIISYLEKMKEKLGSKPIDKRPVAEMQKARLEITLNYLINNRGTNFNRKEFTRSTLHRIATRFNTAYADLLKWFLSVLKEEEKLNRQDSRLSKLIYSLAEEDLDDVISKKEPGNDPSSSNTQTEWIEKLKSRTIIKEGYAIVFLPEEMPLLSSAGFSQALATYTQQLYPSKIGAEANIIAISNRAMIGKIRFGQIIQRQQLAYLVKYYLLYECLPARHSYFTKELFAGVFSAWMAYYPNEAGEQLRHILALLENKIDSATVLYARLKIVAQLIVPAEATKIIRGISGLISQIEENNPLFAINAIDSNIYALTWEKSVTYLTDSSQAVSADKLLHYLSSEISLLSGYASEIYFPVSIATINTMLATRKSAPDKDLLAHLPAQAKREYLLCAIENYLLGGRLAWWAETGSPAKIILQLVLAKSPRFLQLIIKHRSNTHFLRRLSREISEMEEQGYLSVISNIGNTNGNFLFQFYKQLYCYTVSSHIYDPVVKTRIAQCAFRIVIQKKSWTITETVFIRELFTDLLSRRINQRKAFFRLADKLSGMPSARTLFLQGNDETLLRMAISGIIGPEKAQQNSKTFRLAFDIFHIFWIKNYQQHFTGKMSFPFHLSYLQKKYPGSSGYQEQIQRMVDEFSRGSLSFTETITRMIENETNAATKLRLLRLVIGSPYLRIPFFAGLTESRLKTWVGLLAKHRQSQGFFYEEIILFAKNILAAGQQNIFLLWKELIQILVQKKSSMPAWFLQRIIESLMRLSDQSMPALLTAFIKYVGESGFTGRKSSWLEIAAAILDNKKLSAKKQSSRLPKKTKARKPLLVKPPATVSKKLPSISPEEDEYIYINNAGLVLLHPFIKQLFTRLSYLDENNFRENGEAARAVHLLEYAVAGLENVEEPFLFFNKILCGLDPGETIDRDLLLTQEEKEMAEGLLNAIITNWPPMKNSSLEGLRGNFLMREGRLRLKEQGWELAVEKKPYDLLIKQLPWGISMISFPWMHKPVFVQWT